MARLPETASLETMLDFIAQVRAGLAALDELAPLAGPFEGLTTRVRDARDKRDDARWTLLGKSARVRVFDSRWDAGVKGLSGQAFLIAGKDAAKDPYNVLFGTVKADDASRLGPSKAEAFGNALLMRIKALGNAVLDAMATLLAATQAKLRVAPSGTSVTIDVAPPTSENAPPLPSPQPAPP